MDSKMNIQAIQEIMWLDDSDFETAIKELDMRGILWLMEALQTAMCEEQKQFEQLTLQLQKHPDRNSYNHRKISAALCTAQRLLTNLCTKHMMCSGQRSLRSSFDDDCSSEDTTPVVTVHKMASSPLQNGNGGTTGFKESLRFFQSQVEKGSIHSTTKSSTTSKKTLMNGYAKSQMSTDLGFQTKSGVRTATSIPTVDNILSNVKNLCSARNNSNDTPDSVPKFSSLHRSASENFSKNNENKQNPVVFHTFDNRLYNNATVTRSEQVSVSEKTYVNEHSKKPSLLSNFNPSFECNDSNEQKERNKSDDNISIHSETNKACDYFEPRNALESDSKKTQPTGLYGKINNLSSLRTVSSSSNEYIVSNSSLNNSVNREDKVVPENAKKSLDIPINRTFGQCKERLAQLELNKAPTGKSSSKISEEGKDQATKTSESVRVTEWNKKGEENVAEKQGDSFEDYDPQDFVVHKANFSEDYLEEMSEDNYSSVNEDYEVEHPHDPDIPSPDYVSDEEEEYLVQQDESQDYDDDGEFIDNSAQYMNDPRRYIYFPEDKELEVIPEEDEEDIEDDDDMFSHEEPYKSGGFQISNPGSDDSRYINHGECDSGLTDDQRSSSSTAEECDLEDDTDSAKGSLPLQDSCNDSPTCNERANMFQNVEYHKSNKRNNYPSKRIIEDYEKPKLKGKDINTIPHEAQNGVDSDELRQARSVTSSWDPKELLDALYRLDFPNKPFKKQIRYINKEGYLEKLPSGRKKATYWNPWKTKYIKLKDGFLYCFDNNRTEKPSMTMQLMGGHIDTLENKMIGVDDQKGHYVVLRCSNEDDLELWENALQSQCAEDFVNAYTSPCLRPLPINKNVVIIDLGSCSVRAGILMSSPSLPQMFFPTVCASNKISHKKIFGIEALNPNIRKESYLTFPLHPSAKVTKYSIDVSLLPDLLKHIFQELNIYPEDYKVQLSMPRNLSLQTKLKVARILLDDFRVKGLNLTHQAILSLHAYNSKSGIIVDIGDRLDVIPIIEGYIVESGVTRLPYGGQRMIHHLKHALAEKNISVISDVETYLARYVLEQLCYVAEDYNDELQRFHTHPDDFEMSISTSHFFKGECPWEEIILDMGRFHVAEGLFTPEHWGLDNPGLHKLVYHAIQECGVDLRREMTKSIYVSGGLTLLPGFVERLEGEIDKLTPHTITPKVHASLYRYHMSFIGACQIALEEKFDDICITKQMWRKEGNTCVKKWHI